MHFGSLQVPLSKIQSRALLKTMHFLKETKWMMPWIFKTHQRDLAQLVYQLRLDYRVILQLHFYLFYRHFDCHKKIEYQYNAACILVEDLFNPKFLASLQVVQSFYSQIADLHCSISLCFYPWIKELCLLFQMNTYQIENVWLINPKRKVPQLMEYIFILFFLFNWMKVHIQDRKSCAVDLEQKEL